MNKLKPKWVVLWIGFALVFFLGETLLINAHNREIYIQRSEVAHESFDKSRQKEDAIHYGYFTCGPTNEKVLTLTFDDGPYADRTPHILDVLKNSKVLGAFFLVGTNAEKNPDLVRRIVIEGHEVGNHTYLDKTASLQTIESWKNEIGRANQAISNILGRSPRFFRAPGCRYTDEALAAIKRLNMMRVDCSNNAFDYNATNANDVLKRLLDKLEPGNLVLLHDSDPQISVVLPKFIHEVRLRGYRFISLIEMMQRSETNANFREPYYLDGQGIVLPTDKDPDFTKTNGVSRD